MSERQPATDKGTADRVEADNGGYWVRLVTKQAMKREGVCMGNCLASQGHGSHTAGDENMVSDGFWSLRKRDGLSYLLIQVEDWGDTTTACVQQAKGPMNSQPSVWSIKQLRHLVAAFHEAGATLRIPDAIALTGEDGRTWRPDKAPLHLKDAVEARPPSDHLDILTSFQTVGTASVQNEMQALGAAVRHGLSSMVEAIGEVATGFRKASVEAQITQVEEALASGTGSLPAGTARLRSLYAQLEALGGPPVRQVRLVRSDAPGISPAA